jgi:SAM-dependent methyltransferase
MNQTSAFYDEAAWYDFLHAPDTDGELDAVLALEERWGNGGRRCLEPACGTGRYLEALARRGWEATGYDANSRALAFARRRLAGTGARALRGDMRSYREPAAYDLAFCTLSSIRHLLREDEIRRHLRRTAASLRPGGIYVVGLDLADYGAAFDDEETWEVSRDGRSARHVMEVFAPDARRRRERILNFVMVQEGGEKRLLRSEYELRSYDLKQWLATVAGAGLRVLASASPSQNAADRLFVLAPRERALKTKSF